MPKVSFKISMPNTSTSKSPTEGDPYLLTVDQLARELGMLPRSIRWLVYNHKIPRVMLGYRTMRFRLEAVKQALAKLEKI
jgi:excisionase family DNA binding protein